ncbi:MAG: FHA domain-containing protein [Gammaproteobacteria bacterium]|nr:FHA domain-containing protein [Gammaproteobacteria bacterium]
METLILQIGGRPGQSNELVKYSGEDIGIGRGFDNRVILNDPFVAPNQASFQYVDGVWYFENLDQLNRVLLNNEYLDSQRVSLQSGDRLVLGRTEIQVFSPDHAVSPTRKLLLSRWLHHHSTGFMVPLLAMVICNLMDFSMDHLLGAIREVEWKSSVVSLLWLNLILLVWAGAWAITGKLIRHQYHFGQQIIITAGGLIGIIFVIPVFDYIAFVSNSTILSILAAVLVMLMLVAWLVKFNMYFATTGRHATVVGMLVSIVLVGGVTTVDFLSKDDFHAYAQTENALYPGFIRFGSAETVDSYFDQVETMLSKSGRD